MDNPEIKEEEVIEADTVYLLMKKGFPISRNVRAQWMLQHLDTVVKIQQPSYKHEESPDLEIVSILPKNKIPSWSEENSWTFSYHISSSTSIIFLGHKYRMVFNLDLSPSLATVDVQHGEIVTDEVCLATKQCLEGITKPFIVPGSKRVMSPEIYVTVIAHTPFFTNPAQQVLVQGWLLTVQNINCLMEFIEKKLHILEEKVASITGVINHQLEVLRAQNERLVGGLFEEGGATSNKNSGLNNVSMVSPETCFVNILRYGLMALSVLPEYSCAHLVVVTDGIVGVTDIHVLDSVVQQLRAKTVACSFLHVGSSYHPHCANGLVPNQDLLFFLVTATLGTYMTFSSQMNCLELKEEMNNYQKNFLFWRLNRTMPYVVSQENTNNWHTNNFLFYGREPPPLLRKKQIDSKVSCTLSNLLCCRLREGYLIKRAQIHDGFVEICFILPWKNHVFIEYMVTSPWVSKSLSCCNTVQYTITIEAPYEFLHDITCSSKKPIKSQYRQSVVSRFWSVVTSLTESDTMLSHFSWFPSMNWTWYNVPDTIKSGMPLFYLPCSSPSTIQLSDVACPQFGQIWQPVVSMEPYQWARWMHCQRITLIFAHDRPLPKHLHLANQSGRFQCVQYRQAAAMLYAMLKNWATFVLVENHMYISFIYKELDKPPVSFCLISVNCKSLCAVLNVAFSGGTEGVLRHNVMTDLLDKVSKLTFPNRPITEQRETPCCSIVHKALEKFLIKYERVPSDLNTITYPDGSQFLNRNASIVYSNMTTLSRYLYHSRWLWLIKKPLVHTLPRVELSKLNIAAIARILSTITKTRLAEGFTFAHSSAGIINMVLEVQVQNPANEKHNPCIIQYILFPTHVIHSNLERESISDDETDEDVECGVDDIESSGDFEIVTEIWIEPQCGFVQMPPYHKASYLNGLQFDQISHRISKVDKQCIDALLTLEHLSLISQVDQDERSNDSTACVQFQDMQTSQSNYSGSKKATTRPIITDFCDNNPSIDDRIHPMLFVFDIMNVLPKCQQAELLFSMFDDAGLSSDYSVGTSANNILIEGLLERTKFLHSKELMLSMEESQQFTEMLLNRPRYGASRNFTIVTEKDDTDCIAYPQWKCYIKGISVTHVIVTILPASEADVQLLRYTRICDNQLKDWSNVSDASILNDIKSRSENSLNRTPTTNDKYGLILPIYVYDCSLSVLIDAFIDKLDFPRARDIFKDHTFKIGEQLQEEFIHLKPGGEIKSSSPEPKSEDSDNVPNDQLNLMEHCKTLALAHCNAYVVSVYKTLILQNKLSYEDMEAAVDQCEESPIEINITNYLRSVCKHLGSLYQNEAKCSTDQLTCNHMEPLHNLIKEKFKRIMNVAFRPISTYPELYYYVPPWNSENLRMSESHQSVYNNVEDFTFHSIIDDRKLSNSTGLNTANPINKGMTSDMYEGSKLSSCPSVESFINELHIDVEDGKDHPLFLQLICSIHSKSVFSNIAVKVLPTCFIDIVEKFDEFKNHDVKDLKITLDIIRLNLPKDVLEVHTEPNLSGLRTTSYCSTSSVGSVYTEDDNNICNSTQFSEMEQLQEEINHLPPYQTRAILSLVDEIEWLLQDETATALLDEETPKEETLKFVAKHVSESAEKFSCCLDKVPLHFVFPSEISAPIFLEELKKLRVDRYCVQQEGNLFYCVKSNDDSFEQRENNLDDQHSDKDNTSFRNKSQDNESFLDGIIFKKQDSSDPSGCHSEISSIGGEDDVGTDDGYEGGSSNAEDDCQWLIELDRRRTLLPNFWLILHVENSQVKVYFHCRFLELPSSEVVRYQQVQKLVVSQIKDICIRVNQYLLLRNLHDKRICDNLLEDAKSNESDVWRGVDAPENPTIIPNNNQNQKNLTPGMFRCPIVWEWPFCLHPRLKTGPSRSGISRGVKALHGVLNRFSVNNRNNMFVYQQHDGNVFYLRLHEQTNDGKSLQSKLSESDEKLMVSRSSSVASLSQSKGQPSDQSSLHSDSRPRVRSFGEKESDIMNKSGDSIILMVHGISEAGAEIKHELVQVLQNRLDDAVLEVLSVMLARNPMCKLSPSDVHFIQKPYKSPETVIRLTAQDHCLTHLSALKYYLNQNILQFLYIPKYTDPRTHYHFQDYSQPEGSKKRVPESDIFLYNQSPASGNKGIACIAMGIVDCKGDIIAPDNGDAETEFFTDYPKICDFQNMLITNFYDGNSELDTKAFIEFKIWKQGRVNHELLKDKLRSAVRHSVWDLLTEYAFLPTPLTLPASTDEGETKNDLITDDYDTGDKGILHPVYRTTLAYWLQYGLEIAVPAVKKHVVTFEQNHGLIVTLKELQHLIQTHAPDAITKTFVHQERQPFYNRIENDEILLKKTNDNIEGGNCSWLKSAVEENTYSYVPYDFAIEERKFFINSVVIARNCNQCKSASTKTVGSDHSLSKDQNLCQKFNPLLLEGSFVPRQKLLLAKVQRNNIILYVYNWSKEKHEKLMKYVTNLGSWLSTRSSFYSNITMQKLGIFYHPKHSREQDNHKMYDLENLIKFPHMDKDLQRSTSRVHSANKTSLSWQQLTDQAMRDTKSKASNVGNVSDVVVKAIMEFQLMKQNDKKAKDDLHKLHSMWQSRNTVSNIALSQTTLDTFKQHSRLLHYCFTPLLFLPSWRLQSAATRDHSILPTSTQSTNSVNQHAFNHKNQLTNSKIVAEWHRELCNTMITEYKQYLQTLGFNSVHIEYGKIEEDSVPNQTLYLQKSMLGGIFLFCIQLSEPFFAVKLKVIECSRLQNKTSSPLINQFIVSFMDSCDKIKINMHLHSFTYDFHLRCIHSYIAGTGQWSLQHGYHLTHFLDDFNKYYSKAPNYARNLAYSGVIKVSDLAVPAHTLYSYLLSHQKMYGMQVFSMFNESNNVEDSEYVLVKLQSTPLVSYCDAQDKKCIDDFDVALIVACLEEPFSSPYNQEIILKYYLVLTSKREHYPKREVENNKLGKYRTVFSAVKSMTNSQIDSPSESSPVSRTLSLRKNSKCEVPSLKDQTDTTPSSSSSNLATIRDEEVTLDDQKDIDKSLAPTPPPVPDSPLAQSILNSSSSTTNLVQIRQESINYFGYYSSHEQLMQQLIMSQAQAAKEHITNMIHKGDLHCRTHLLWNKLLENRSTMTYAEFMELRNLAFVEPVSSIDPRLSMFINQPIAWYQTLAKVLQNRYQEYHKQFNSPDGNITHHLILHPSYVQAFMMLTIDLHASRGELYAVYRKAAEISDVPFTMADIYSLIEGFVNACCFHLWVGMFN